MSVEGTQIALALISAASGAFSAWMARRSRRHAFVAVIAKEQAQFAANSIRPSMYDLPPSDPPASSDFGGVKTR